VDGAACGSICEDACEPDKPEPPVSFRILVRDRREDKLPNDPPERGADTPICAMHERA
jgi:hypothetical protein